MSGPSFAFVGFAALVALVMNASRAAAWRRGVLLIASLVFLATFSRDPVAFVPLAGFVLVGFVALRAAARRRQTTPAIAVTLILALFVWIKKYAFVPSGAWLPFPYVTIGISYMLFRILHLVIEAHDDESLTQVSFGAYLTYVIAFNTLVAGPIQTYDDYRGQEETARAGRVTLVDVGEGAERIVLGLFKTNVLAAVLAALRDGALSRLTTSSPAGAGQLFDGALVFVLYPLFLYCNFSGYIDIVIGVSRFFDHRLPENFERPFSATSFIDFWNRWHITLSLWLRTYVYNRLLLSLMRRFPSRRAESAAAVFAFFVTFFLVGVWHGQTLAFLFFGFLQGGGVSVNKLYEIAMVDWLGRKGYRRLVAQPVYEIFARGLTFTWFTFTLTWFWAGWREAAGVWASLSVGEWVLVWSAILVAASAVLWMWELLRAALLRACWRDVVLACSPRVRTAWLTGLLFIVTLVTILSNQGAPDIVYKNF